MKNRKRITKLGFQRWAQAQPATKVWDFYDFLGCPLVCYLQSLGYTEVDAGGWTWSSRETGGRNARKDIPESIRAALAKATKGTRHNTAGVLPITQPQLVLACS